MSNISVFSFFSGSGLLDLGFEDAGCEIVFVNEYYLPFLNAYKYSRSKIGYNEPKYGYSDQNINEYLIPKNQKFFVDAIYKERQKNKITGFIGGPPCPDFSVGGKNKGRHGDNGKLSEVYIDLVCKLNPDFVLFENVKGLWRTKRHREFYEEIKSKLHSSNYVTTEHLINSIEFGVPQDRDRILLFGIRKSLLTGANAIDNFAWDTYKKYKKNDVTLLKWPTTNKFNAKIQPSANLPIKLTINHWFKKNDVSKHPNSNDHFQPRSGLVKFQTIDEGDVSKKSYKRLHRYRYSPTAAYGNNEVHLHPTEARRISVAEALAIQSLPKEFELPSEMSLTNKFKTIGNGVPYLLSKGIANTIKDFIASNLTGE